MTDSNFTIYGDILNNEFINNIDKDKTREEIKELVNQKVTEHTKAENEIFEELGVSTQQNLNLEGLTNLVWKLHQDNKEAEGVKGIYTVLMEDEGSHYYGLTANIERDKQFHLESEDADCLFAYCEGNIMTDITTFTSQYSGNTAGATKSKLNGNYVLDLILEFNLNILKRDN